MPVPKSHSPLIKTAHPLLTFYHSNALVPAITFSFMMYCLLPCLSLSPRGFYLSEKKSLPFLSLIAASLLHHISYSLVTLQARFNQTELMIYVTQHYYVIPMEHTTEKMDMSTKLVSATLMFFPHSAIDAPLGSTEDEKRSHTHTHTKMLHQTGDGGERGRQLQWPLSGSGDSE